MDTSLLEFCREAKDKKCEGNPNGHECRLEQGMVNQENIESKGDRQTFLEATLNTKPGKDHIV